MNDLSQKNRKRILLIDDNYDTQLIFKIYLRNSFELEITDTAESGIELLKKNKYDLLILDINLPGKLDGSAVLNELRNVMNKKDFPVLVVTAYAMKGDKERFLKQGANDYLSKPVMKDDFLNRVNYFTSVA